jgi:hypothetical protein
MINEDDFWSNWWNENLQGKPKYSEKTYSSATLSTTKSLMTDPVSNPGPQQWEASDYPLKLWRGLWVCCKEEVLGKWEVDPKDYIRAE